MILLNVKTNKFRVTSPWHVTYTLVTDAYPAWTIMEELAYT